MGGTLIGGDKLPPKERILRIKTKCGKIVHIKQNAYTEPSSLMVPDSSNMIMSHCLDQIFSGRRKNIRTLELLTALFVIMAIHFWKYVIQNKFT